jgi:tRNA threonylcarbamoyladenosine biosynthesis protein TsaB
MILLALDTAAPVTAVALLEDQKVLGELYQPAKNHSVMLLPSVDRLMKENRIARHDLDAVAVGIGPGSFTGVRVGLALVKSMAFALDLDLVGVSTLAALARNGWGGKADWICPTMDALKKEVYGARCRADGALDESEAAHDPREWAEHLSKAEGRCLLLGTGALRYRDVFVEVLDDRAIIPNEEERHRVSAAAVGLLGFERLQRGEKDDPRTLEPVYCRLSEAELARIKKT